LQASGLIRKARAILSGLVTWLPGFPAMRGTGGTDSARYCYSVWLRHLKLANAARPGLGVPRAVAELGPGDSIGIGLCALLSGADKYYAFDVVAYPDLRSNLAIFDELLRLFQGREAIPGPDEFPGLLPAIDDLSFPHELLNDANQLIALDRDRVQRIRKSIENAESSGSSIVYRAPWTGSRVIEPGTIDMIFSQAVLEHVVDLPDVYGAMRRWIKSDGVMTHQIDYRCHGKADHWNGHWGFSELSWRIAVGRRPYLLNRAPHSIQISLLREAGFKVLAEVRMTDSGGLRREKLAVQFRDLSDHDLTTCGAFVVSMPGALPAR
jgi:hypothetical protein